MTVSNQVMAIGLGATLFMDLLALVLARVFGMPPANYCFVGRWLGHMPNGTFIHAHIAAAPHKRFECALGWVAHYFIGTVFALAFVACVSGSWLAHPTVVPAMLFGIGTVLLPFLVMQPSFGLGIAASKAPNPAQARLRSLVAHTAFGVGLYVCAVGVNRILQVPT